MQNETTNEEAGVLANKFSHALKLTRKKSDARKIFRETIRYLEPNISTYAAMVIIHAAEKRLGLRGVYRELLELPDGRLRNVLLKTLFDYECNIHRVSASRFARRIALKIVSSEFIRVDDLHGLLGYYCTFAREIAERTLLMISDEPVGLSNLLHRLLCGYSDDLTHNQRERVIAALIGLESTHATELMLVVERFPAHRRDAAAVALNRGGLERCDICLLLSFHDTSDMAEAALQSQNPGSD